MVFRKEGFFQDSFALYMNDLPAELKHFKIAMCAEDAKIHAPVHTDPCIGSIQADLNILEKWCDKWKLKLNANKCFLIQYNPRSNARSFNSTYKIGQHTLEKKSACKDLGIVISEELKFRVLTDKACNRQTLKLGE